MKSVLLKMAPCLLLAGFLTAGCETNTPAPAGDPSSVIKPIDGNSPPGSQGKVMPGTGGPGGGGGPQGHVQGAPR